MPDKWYLNLKPTADQKNRGPVIPLEAKRNVFHSPGNIRRTVQWVVAQDLQGLDATLLDATVGTLDKGPQTAESANHRFVNELNPGPATKVIYTVTAQKGAVQGGNNVTFRKEYETWRKVFYDVVYMEGTKAHYDAIKATFIATWAAVGYEFVEKRVVRALVNETTTDCGINAKLPHLYNTALSEKPNHVRLVIVRDIVDVKEAESEWRMDRTTEQKTGLTRIWSTGDNVTHYASPIQVMDGAPMVNGVVRVIGLINVPGPAITRVDDHTVAIDTSLPALALAKAALVASRKVSLAVKLKASRALTMNLKIKLDHESRTRQPLRAGTTTIALAENNHVWTITLTDPTRTFVAAPVLSASLDLQESRQHGSKDLLNTHKNDVAAHVVRQSDHVVVLTVPDVDGAPAMLRSLTLIRNKVKNEWLVTRFSLELKLLYGAQPTEDAIDAEVKGFGTELVRYDAVADRILVHDQARVFDLATPLVTAQLLYSGADTAIPAGAVTRNGGDHKQVDFNLQYAGLGALHTAFGRGDKLEFKVKLKSTMSTGGYNISDETHFVALTTRRMSDTETVETTRARLLRTALHELGHAHKIVDDETGYAGGAVQKSNARYYKDEYGGQGPHCSYNAHLMPSGPSYGELPTTSGQVYKHAGGAKLCLMYHRLDLAHMGTEFCSTCAEQLRLASGIGFTTK